MKKVYLDNASTSVVRDEVIQEMVTVLRDYGNPSSPHSFGRSARTILELSRKKIAGFLGCSAQEIIFTSGGTEADNLVLQSAVRDLKVKRIVTSKVEHHAVLNTVLNIQHQLGVAVDFVAILPDGGINLTHLSQLLADKKKTLVSLMHVNNETGAVADLVKIGQICQQFGALFHSDTVQSIGKTEINLQEIPVDFIVASAHKFHGPKGVGFVYVKKNSGLQPLFFGGEQEKGLRAGTEAVHQIAGMAKALELSIANLETERNHILELKNYLLSKLEIDFPGFKINGKAEGFYNILNVTLPLAAEKTAMILFSLDMKGIAVSRGSACQSGSVRPSHVLQEMLTPEELALPNLRISLSCFNTREEIDYFIDSLKTI